jgi:trigger factor
MKINIKKLPKSEVEIDGELDANLFESYYARALKKIGENVEIDGFRKGKVPEDTLAKKIPEITILEEMAQLALNEHYPKILEEEKIDAISRPEISITKLARNNPLGFKIRTATLPAIKLPDYKKLAKKIITDIPEKEKDTEVTAEDMENTILDIRKSRAPKINMADVPEVAKEGVESKIPEPELPEFNDEFVKALGPFENVEDFKSKLKENIKIEKVNNLKEKTRVKIMEKIIDESELEVPDILTEMEVDKILYKMESDITQMGLKFEDYLQHLKKTREELRSEFRKDGEKKAKLSLILNEIAKVEKVVASPEAVAKEVAHILEHYKEADPERAQMHAENVLTNEMIFNLLENQ